MTCEDQFGLACRTECGWDGSTPSEMRERRFSMVARLDSERVQMGMVPIGMGLLMLGVMVSSTL